MYKILSELMDGVAQAYGDTAKAMKGTQDLPKAPVPDVRHLLKGRPAKDPQAFYGLKETPAIRWQKTVSRYALAGLDTYEGTFPSPLYTPFPANNRVRVVWAKHRDRQPRPTVIILHGLVMPDYAGMDQLPFWFRLHGMDGVLIDLPYHMSRTPAHVNSGDLALRANADWVLSVMLQCVLDIRALAAWLRENTPTPAIGYFGISLGAYLGLLLSCVCRDFDFGMSVVAVVDTLEAFLRFEDLGEEILSYEKEMGHDHPIRTDPRMDTLLSPLHMKLLQNPDSIFMANGEFDHLVPPDHALQFANKWKLPHFHLYPAGHISTITANPPMWRELHQFMALAGSGGFNRT